MLTKQIYYNTVIRLAHFTHELLPLYIPTEASSKIIDDNQSLKFHFSAEEDLVIENVYFKDFFNNSVIMISIDNKNFVNVVFPIYISKGQNVIISVYFSSDTAQKYSHIATNLYIDFRTASDNQRHQHISYITLDPVYPIIDNDLKHVNEMIDHFKVD